MFRSFSQALLNCLRILRVEILGQYGNLTVAMPDPALLSAAKLVRGDPRDTEDVAWWVKERALDLDEIRAAIGSLPDATNVKPPAKIFS